MFARKNARTASGTVHILLLAGASLCACMEPASPPPRASPTASVDAGSALPSSDSAVAALPQAVETARSQLIRFRELDAGTLENALKTLDAFEQPKRYEEQGLADGKPYYYLTLRYEKTGLKVHSDGKRITNVEQSGRRP